MPNTTGDFPMPYPNSSAVPDVPGDLLALAQAVDDTLSNDIVSPFVVLRKTANQNLTVSPAAVTWDVEDVDAFGMHDNAVNNSRITAPLDGWYEVSVSVFNTNTTGFSTMTGRAQGTTAIPGSTDRRGPVSSNAFSMRSTFYHYLTAGQYVEVLIDHSTATGAIEGGSAAGGARLTMKRIGL